VHTGELFPVDEAHRPRPDSVMNTALKVFKPGDVLAHVYSSMPDGIVGNGEGIPEFVRRANDHGILFDIGYGINFSYAIARKMMAAGIYPRTISSDTHGDFTAYHDNSKLDYSLCGAMTRLWALGMPLDQVVAATTVHPAQILREETRLGSLKPGRRADVTILDMVEGEWQMRDGSGEVLKVNTRLVPAKVVRAGEVIESKRTYVRDVWPTPLPVAAE
jgi:dihydroorotase